MKIHETIKLAAVWERMTGESLRRFVEFLPTRDVVPDVAALEEWLQPHEGESVAESLERRYGRTAVECMERLFN